MAELNEGQKKAAAEILDWLSSDSPAISLSGPAGTGKTFLTRELLPTLSSEHTVLLTATTGKAALRLAQLAGSEAKTLHSALYEPPGDEWKGVEGKGLVFDKMRVPPSGAVLVIDEASMLTPDVWKDVTKWVKQCGIRVLLIGDGFQLPPVMKFDEEDGGFNIFSEVKGPRLSQVMRNGDAILDAATVLRSEGRLIREDRGAYRWRRAKLARVLEEWLQNQNDHAIITWRNKVRMDINRILRQALGFESQFPQDGEPILVRQNARGFLNGQIVEMVGASKPGPELGRIRASWLRVMSDSAERTMFASCQGREETMDGLIPWLDEDAWKEYIKAKRRFEYGRAKERLEKWAQEKGIDPWKLDIDKFVVRMDPTPVTWGYCLTCHAGQGSEWDRVTVFLAAWDGSSSNFTKPSVLPDGTKVPFWTRWTYTAITRAKTRVDVVIGE